MSHLMHRQPDQTPTAVTIVGDGDTPPAAPYVVTDACAAEEPGLLDAEHCMGIAPANTLDVESAEWDWNRFELIVLSFPAFTDGRAYSQARVLRDRLGFEGELRATGDVLCDQLSYLADCGFDSFDLRDDQSVEQARESLQEFTVGYTPGHARQAAVISARRARG